MYHIKRCLNCVVLVFTGLSSPYQEGVFSDIQETTEISFRGLNLFHINYT